MKINTLTIPCIENAENHKVEFRTYNISVIAQLTSDNVFLDDRLYFIIKHNIKDETILKYYDIWLGCDIYDTKKFSIMLMLRDEFKDNDVLDYLDSLIDDEDYLELFELTNTEKAVISQYVGSEAKEKGWLLASLLIIGFVTFRSGWFYTKGSIYKNSIFNAFINRIIFYYFFQHSSNFFYSYMSRF